MVFVFLVLFLSFPSQLSQLLPTLFPFTLNSPRSSITRFSSFFKDFISKTSLWLQSIITPIQQPLLTTTIKFPFTGNSRLILEFFREYSLLLYFISHYEP